MKAIGTACLTFSYHMYGDHVGTLMVYTTDGSDSHSVWKASGNQGNMWKSVSLDISLSSANWTTSVSSKEKKKKHSYNL